MNTTVEFETKSLDGTIIWTVNGEPDGNALVGTVADGTYTAPARVPRPATVTVGAADAADATRHDTFDVTVTAPGTLYLYFGNVFVYDDMDRVGGAPAPDREFALDGLSEYSPTGMTMAPAADAAFVVGDSPGTPGIAPTVLARLDDASTATGTVTAALLGVEGLSLTGGLAYDHERDILYAVSRDTVLVYEDATESADGTGPTRTFTATGLGGGNGHDGQVALDVGGDRLFFSDTRGTVHVYEAASNLEGAATADQAIELQVPDNQIFGIAYDAARDELYVGAPFAEAIYVVAGASSADGPVAPARTIEGSATGFEFPNRVLYDVANDRLVVVDYDARDVKAFDAASTLDGNVAPSRVLSYTGLPFGTINGGYLDPTM